MTLIFSHLPEPIQILLLILIVYFLIWILCVFATAIIVAIFALKLFSTYFGNADTSSSLSALNKSLYFLFHIGLVPIYAVIGVTLSVVYLFIASFLNCVLLGWAILWLFYSKIVFLCVKPKRQKSIVFPSFDFSRSSEIEDSHRWREILLKKTIF